MNAVALYLAIENESVDLGQEGTPQRDSYREYMREARQTLANRFFGEGLERLAAIRGPCFAIEVVWSYIERVIMDGEKAGVMATDPLIAFFQRHTQIDGCIECRDRGDHRAFSVRTCERWRMP